MITEKLSGNAISYRRFSSIEQAQGDSLRRQKESFETFKERHDLEVLSEVEDLGKSAYHDEQFTKGGLGALVQAIEDEKVDVKSKPFYLIMESLDRYSRAHPHEALVSFLSLLNKGVNVITLSDQQLYKQKASPDSIMLALMQLSRANMESEIKSSRIKEAYAEKWKSYRNGVGRKLNSHPKWFKQVQIENSNEWRLEPIPEQVEVVKRIFEMSLVYGKPTICSILNEEGTLSFTGRKWKTSSIVNLFKNKRVLGQLDICTKQEDPETKNMIASQPIVIAGCDSRFEYDLNRDPEHAVFDTAWGKQLWRKPLSEDMKDKSLRKHNNFYKVAHTLIETLESKFGFCTVYDMHSYNWKRWDREVPTWNLGTSNIDNNRFGDVVESWRASLSEIKLPNTIKPTSKINDTFQGNGYFLKYITNNFKNTLVLATEISKIYCDEYDYIIYPEVVKIVANELKNHIPKHALSTFEAFKK